MTDRDKSRGRVRQLYERFPYPSRQTDLTPILQGQVLELGFPGIFFYKYWPFEAYREDLNILIAGCGSTQAARYAAAHSNARVTGIDLSEASLESTRQLAVSHGLKNLNLHRLEIERAKDLDQRFDLIVSTGVIHHLPEPEVGLQALRGVLKPEGAMYLMLYAPHGRDAIYYLQELLSGLGLESGAMTDSEIQSLKRLVDELPAAHPLWQRRRAFQDLTNTAELMDYLLHPQDRPFTIGECYDLLDECGLAMQGLFNRAHYLIPKQGAAGNVLYPRWSAMDERKRLELGELYRAALIRHDLIACRDDKPREQRTCDTALDWDRLIPVPVPGIQESREGVSADKVANLYWPAHGFKDIRLPVDRDELALVRAVNGERSVGEIQQALTDNKLALDRERLKRFLDTLFDYDFIWFRYQ